MPTLDLNGARLDPTKIERGIWWRIRVTSSDQHGPRFDGEALPGLPGDEPALLIRTAGDGIEHQRAREDAEKPFRIELREGRITPAALRTINAEAIARAFWRGAHNITIGGKPFEWSEAEAARMLARPEWWNLQDFIVEKATNRAALAAEEEEKAAGN